MLMRDLKLGFILVIITVRCIPFFFVLSNVDRA